MKQTSLLNGKAGIGILCALVLLLGLFAGASLFSTHTTETKYVDKTVEKLVNQTVYEQVEVPFDYLDAAKSKFLQAVEDGEDEAGNDNDVLGNYDFDEVSVKKISDDYVIEYFDDDKYTISFSIDLKFKETGEASEVNSYDVSVVYEKGEDTEVLIA